MSKRAVDGIADGIDGIADGIFGRKLFLHLTDSDIWLFRPTAPKLPICPGPLNYLLVLYLMPSYLFYIYCPSVGLPLALGKSHGDYGPGKFGI